MLEEIGTQPLLDNRPRVECHSQLKCTPLLVETIYHPQSPGQVQHGSDGTDRLSIETVHSSNL